MCTHTQIERKHFFLCTCNHDLESSVPPTHTHTHTQGDSAWKLRHVPTKHQTLYPKDFLCTYGRDALYAFSFQLKSFYYLHSTNKRFKTAQLYTEHQKCQTQRVEKKPMLITAAAEQTLFICRDLQCTNCTDGPCRASWGLSALPHRWKSPGLRLDTRILYR